MIKNVSAEGAKFEYLFAKSLLTLNHTKKICIFAAMIVPWSTLRARAEVPLLKDSLNLRQSCSLHHESVVRLDGC